MSRIRFGCDRDLVAVVVNLKEQRCLQKCLHTLDMEQTYATKVLELDHRILKIYFNRLKEKVSRIKSNLTMEEICELKRLEAQGKLKTTYSPVASNSALKIAAACRCLKLDQCVSLGENSRKFSKRPETSRHGSTCNTSVESRGELMKLVSESAGYGYKGGKSISNNKRNGNNIIKGRPLTSVPVKGVRNVRNLLHRPTTAPLSAHAPFSSHVERDDSDLIAHLASDELTMLASLDCDIGSNLGENLYEEKRKELLQSELSRGKELDKKTKDFIENLKRFSAVPVSNSNLDNLAVIAPIDKTIFTQDLVDGERDSLDKIPHYELDHMNISKEDYQEKLMGLWKDLNKCRYLRVTEDMLDHSGVVTLAKDQMKQFVNIHNFGMQQQFRS